MMRQFSAQRRANRTKGRKKENEMPAARDHEDKITPAEKVKPTATGLATELAVRMRSAWTAIRYATTTVVNFNPDLSSAMERKVTESKIIAAPASDIRPTIRRRCRKQKRWRWRRRAE